MNLGHQYVSGHTKAIDEYCPGPARERGSSHSDHQIRLTEEGVGVDADELDVADEAVHVVVPARLR